MSGEAPRIGPDCVSGEAPRIGPDCVHAARRGSRGLGDRRGVALLLVLVILSMLIIAVYLFQRRAVLHVTVAENRLAAGRAESIARGGIRMAEAMLFLQRLEAEAATAAGGGGDGETPTLPGGTPGAASGDAWKRLGRMPIEVGDGATLRLTIENVGSRLNLNALVPPAADAEGTGPSEADKEEAQLYLEQVLRYVIDGMDVPREERRYDESLIARSLVDWMDTDDTSLGGGGENTYYSRQDPPYGARNGPFLSVDEIGLVEGVDPALLEALREYVTVHPIGGREGIDLNSAEPWVLRIVYAGPSGDRELASERTVREIWKARQEGRKLCTDGGGEDEECLPLSEVGLGEGSLYPEVALPSEPRVFRVEATARVGALTRRLEAVIDVRDTEGPQLLSWRYLRGRG